MTALTGQDQSPTGVSAVPVAIPAILFLVTLQVPFDAFPAVLERVLGIRHVFLTSHSSGALVTAADAGRAALVASVVPSSVAETRKVLEGAGLEVFEGAWSGVDGTNLACESTEAFIAAVAYESTEARPGIWVDAYSSLPTQVQVLRTMFDEFRETGELSDVSFEEFVRLANPTVVILSPSDLRSFLGQKNAESAVPC